MLDFCIIGAPKCGTTALHTYLGDHPSVFVPWLKEPQYYCADLPGLAQVDDRRSYQALFEGAPAGHLRGEASVWYLFSRVAVPRLLDDSPDARLIVMLRNPVDMAHSLHAQLLSSLREDVVDFEEAWARQAARLRGEQLPRYCRVPSTLQYREVCSFAPQLERLFRHAGHGRVEVLLYEEFFADPGAGYRSVLNFLRLADDGRRAFPQVNASESYRSQTLIDLLNRLPQRLDPMLYGAKRFANRSRFRPIRMLKRLNARPQKRQPLSPAFRSQLAHEFADDLRATELLLGRPLDIWRRAMQVA